jgi:hypothetical protein
MPSEVERCGSFAPSRFPRREERQGPDRVRTPHRPEGRPVAVRVFEGSAADPAAFTAIADVVDKAFRLRKMVMVGDCAMITSARIEALRELDDKYTSITALRSPAIRKLMADDGPLQLSLFDEQDLAEVTSDDFPGDRLVACRLAVERRQDHIPEEALLDGIYVMRTPSPPKPSTPPQRSPPTRASSTSSATSGTSNPTTWT